MFCGFAIRSREIVICYGLGDYKSPGLIGRTFFTTDFKSVGTPNGGVGRLAGGGIFMAQKKVVES